MSAQANQLASFLAGLRGRAVVAQLLQKMWRPSGTEYARVREYSLTDETDPNELATTIMSDAEEDAGDVGGVCTYVVVGKDESDRVLERKSFRTDGGRLSGGADREDEPTTQGQLQMLMRHVEARERTSALRDGQAFKQQEGINRCYQELIARQSDMLERLQSRELQVMTVLEQVISRSHERELEHKKAEAQLALQTRVLDRLEPAIPAVMNKLLGKPLVPEEAQDALDSLIFSFDEHQLSKIQSVLTHEQTIALGMIATESHKRREQKKQKQQPPEEKATP